jgi:GPI mannosyltransferase 2
MPLVAGLLHLFSPAGVFLMAPYSESLFAFLSLLGLFVYANGKGSLGQSAIVNGYYTMLAGAIFGLSAIVRSNGILAGAIYLIDAVQGVTAVLSGRSTLDRILELTCTICGGLLVAIGFSIPQIQAYVEYCSTQSLDERRPWCQSFPPSIFTFVQSHYW